MKFWVKRKFETLRKLGRVPILFSSIPFYPSLLSLFYSTLFHDSLPLQPTTTLLPSHKSSPTLRHPLSIAREAHLYVYVLRIRSASSKFRPKEAPPLPLSPFGGKSPRRRLGLEALRAFSQLIFRFLWRFGVLVGLR